MFSICCLISDWFINGLQWVIMVDQWPARNGLRFVHGVVETRVNGSPWSLSQFFWRLVCFCSEYHSDHQWPSCSMKMLVSQWLLMMIIMIHDGEQHYPLLINCFTIMNGCGFHVGWFCGGTPRAAIHDSDNKLPAFLRCIIFVDTLIHQLTLDLPWCACHFGTQR